MSAHDTTTEAARGPDEQPPVVAPVGHEGTRVDIDERTAWAVNGFLALLAGLLVLVGAIAVGIFAFLGQPNPDEPSPALLILAVVLVALAFLVLTSVTIIAPGQTKVLQFFGRYVGTNRKTGLTLVMPLTSKRSVSVRVGNFETNALKVNDADGNPVEIAAIIVWQIADTARACFSVEDYAQFVRVQSEAALRHVATTHPYDDYSGQGTSLRGSTDIVSGELAHEVAERVIVAGVEIVEVRISHLAYAPEIAQAMLQRQQAGAIVAARARIVEGAVGMVEMALESLEGKSVVELDAQQRAQMVANLLVVLCGDQKVTPVLNTGNVHP